MKQFYAHISGSRKQTILEHSLNVANIATKALKGHFQNTIYLIAILHDIGKYTNEFQEYLEKVNQGIYIPSGTVLHASTGAKYILDKYHENHDNSSLYTSEMANKNKTAEIIAYVIGSHHSVFDIINENEHIKWETMQVSNEYELAIKNMLQYHIFQNDDAEIIIDQLFLSACEEIQQFQKESMKWSKQVYKDDTLKIACSFNYSILIRMLMSALIYADHIDSRNFNYNVNNSLELPIDFWERQTLFLEEKIQEKETLAKQNCITEKQRNINEKRSFISNSCKKVATYGPGIYQLSVPTGAGKTLSSMRYAYNAALNEKKDRVIFSIPLLAVLEQNVKEFKENTKDQHLLYECHSNVIKETKDDDSKDEDNSKDNNIFNLAINYWDSPIIATTSFQTLECMFDEKKSSIARFHNLINSVIVFDEIQNLPMRSLYLFNLTCNFLSKFFNTTIVLCSATQPALNHLAYNIVLNNHSMMVDSTKLNDVFVRTRIHLPITEDKKPIRSNSMDCANMIQKELLSSNSILFVCNMKKQANEIYKNVKALEINNVRIFHLTTGKCMKHRTEIFEALKQALIESKENKCKVVCIATQLMEAGVDLSFESAFRLMAGLENLIQLIGRCNRSGEFNKLCNVYLIDYEQDGVNEFAYSPLKEMAKEKEVFRRFLLKNYDGGDITSEKNIKTYYELLYTSIERNYGNDNFFNYIIENQQNLLYLLSTNKFSGKYILTQAFKTAYSNFEVFDTKNINVLVPYNEVAKKLIADLESLVNGNPSYKEISSLLESLKHYVINVYKEDDSRIEPIKDIYNNIIAYKLKESYYNYELGLLDV